MRFHGKGSGQNGAGSRQSAPGTGTFRSGKTKEGYRVWWKVLLAVVLTLAVCVGGLLLLLGKNGRALLEGYFLARYAFVEADADLDDATDQALDALVNGLGDRWSYYRNEEDYQALITRRANHYVGVGVTVNLQEREEGLLVQAVTKGGSRRGGGNCNRGYHYRGGRRFHRGRPEAEWIGAD